jgi:AcrR family transcriptional regulator
MSESTLSERVVRVALKLLDAKGVGELSLRSVVAAASTSTQAIYTCFGGRDGLLEAMAREIERELEAELAPLAWGPGGALRVARAMVSWQRRQPERWRLWVERPGVPSPPPALLAAYREAAERGEISESQVSRATTAAWAALIGVLHLSARGGIGRAAEADVVLDALLGGVARVEPKPELRPLGS